MARAGLAVLACAAATVPALCATAAFAEPKAQIEGQLPSDLRAAIVRAVGDTERPIDNRFEARRRAHDAAEDVIAVLRSEGYYAYQVEPDVGEGDQPRPIVRVTPGPRFVLGHARIDWVGPPPDAASAAAAQVALALPPGVPGRAAEVVSAEGRAVAALEKLGYADARTEPRQVVVDHANHTVQPDYRIAAGSIARLDGLQLTTNGRTRAAWLAPLAPWRRGDPYKPEDVAELERRLLDTGVYDSVTVALAPADQLTPEGLRPVVVSLSERQKRTIEVGASYGTTEGAGLDVKWTRYNLLGRADTFSILARASNLDSRVQVDLKQPHWRMPQQTLTERAAVYRTSTPAYDQEGVTLSADVTHRWGQNAIFGFTGTYFTWGGSVDVSRTSEVRVGALTSLGRDITTLAGLLDMALDRSDDPLDPKHGWRVRVRAEPTLLTGDGTLPYLKLTGQASGYLPLSGEGRTVLASRIKLGSIVNGSVADVPAPQRFYAGGGGSVRGFGYQEVGPRLADNTPEGGLSLVEASVELRHELTKEWGVAAFVDAGTIGTSQTPVFHDLSVGAGIGVRYNLGFGPLRVDVAVPLNARHGDAPFQIYVSIGQSF
ncbi:MAG: autotransporter assembly complex protein TamA [Phenylobacterium sp.]